MAGLTPKFAGLYCGGLITLMTKRETAVGPPNTFVPSHAIAAYVGPNATPEAYLDDKMDEILSRGFHLNNKNCYYPSKQEADVKTCCGAINDPVQ